MESVGVVVAFVVYGGLIKLAKVELADKTAA